MNSKHYFLATMHENQNFKQWMYEPLQEILGLDVTFEEILNFNHNIDEALYIEENSFKSYIFLQYFINLDLIKVNEELTKKIEYNEAENIHWLADSHFRPFLFPETILNSNKNQIGYLGDCFINFHINKFWLAIFDFIRVSNPEKLESYRKIKKSPERAS